MRRVLVGLLVISLFIVEPVFAEGRIYIPHLKETFVLSRLLQAFFNPLSVVNVKSADELVAKLTPRAVNPEGKVFNGATNENSLNLVPNFNYANEYSRDGMCQISNVRTNPGDNLMGPSINLNLEYVQKYTYRPIDKSTCVPGGGRPGDKRCCGGETEKEDERGRRITICTDPPDVKLDSKGRMIAGVNSPLLEELNKNLVVGDQSVFRKVYPQTLAADIKEIPAAVSYSVTGQDSAIKESPKLYFPHLGTIYDYFLKGIQTALRPFSSYFSSPTNQGDCNTIAAEKDIPYSCPNPESTEELKNACNINGELQKTIEGAANIAGVPPDILAGVLSIETRNGIFNLSKSELASPYLCKPNYCGAVGAMQLLTTYGVTDECPNQTARIVDNWSKYACRSGSTNPNPGNIPDNIIAGARMIKAISGTSTNYNWTKEEVYRVARSYYGDTNCTPIPGLKPFLREANCGAYESAIPNEELSYCSYLWAYYSPRNP